MWPDAGQLFRDRPGMRIMGTVHKLGASRETVTLGLGGHRLPADVDHPKSVG